MKQVSQSFFSLQKVIIRSKTNPIHNPVNHDSIELPSPSPSQKQIDL